MWVLRMVVRVALVACVAGILPSLVRAAVACALGAASFLAVAVAGGVAIASFAWQELAHPAPATRFEPATRSSDDAPGEKNSRAPASDGGGDERVAELSRQAVDVVRCLFFRHVRG